MVAPTNASPLLFLPGSPLWQWPSHTLLITFPFANLSYPAACHGMNYYSINRPLDIDSDKKIRAPRRHLNAN